jgi:hypothetical protein
MASQPLTHSQLPSSVQSPHTHADLGLPGGGVIGQTPTEELRRILGRLGIEGAHSENRYALVDRYAAMVKQKLSEGGPVAVEDWWKKGSSC